MAVSRFDRRPPERDSTRINERIRVPEVRLIDENGEQVGIVATNEALERARERDLDLVEVAPNSKPPVCRILDYSKYKYEQEQKAKQARKHQQQTNVREIKLRPKIAQHDYETKRGHVERFLKQQDKVKVTIMFRGREQSHPERGRDAPRPAPRGRLGDRGPRAAAPPGGPEHDDAARARRGCRPGEGSSRELALTSPAGGHGLFASIVGPMPKMKTHSGAKKRFRKTAKGKLRGRRAYSSHILEKKSPGRKRRFGRPSEISEADSKRVKKLLVKGGR